MDGLTDGWMDGRTDAAPRGRCPLVPKQPLQGGAARLAVPMRPPGADSGRGGGWRGRAEAASRGVAAPPVAARAASASGQLRRETWAGGAAARLKQRV